MTCSYVDTKRIMKVESRRSTSKLKCHNCGCALADRAFYATWRYPSKCSECSFYNFKEHFYSKILIKISLFVLPALFLMVFIVGGEKALWISYFSIMLVNVLVFHIECKVNPMKAVEPAERENALTKDNYLLLGTLLMILAIVLYNSF